MLWEHPPLVGPTPPAPKPELRLLPGAVGAVPAWFWVDSRNSRVLQAWNPDNPQRAPKLPDTPLPDGNRDYRRYWPPLDKISRETLRRKQRAAGLTLVQQSGVQQITSGLTGTFSITATAGNCLAVYVNTALNTGAGVVGTPTDTKNIYGSAAAVVNTNTGGLRSNWWVANNCAGGTYTITMTLGSAVKANWEVYEWSGVGSVAGNRFVVDANSGATSSGTACSLFSGSPPQQSGSLMLSGVGDGGTATTWTPDGASTSLSQTTTNIDFATSYHVLSSTSVAQTTSSFTQTGSAVQFAGAGIILRPAGTQAVRTLANISSASASSWTSGSYTPIVGTLCILAMQTGATGVTTAVVADTASTPNTWTLIPGGRANNGSGGELSLWWTVITTGGSQTITATAAGGSATARGALIELTGVIPSSTPFDVVLTATGNGTAVSVGPSVATVIPGETALLFAGTPSNSAGTPGGSASLVNEGNSSNGSILAETLLLNATGTQTMTATLGTSSQWSAVLITLKTGGVSMVQSLNTHQAGSPYTTTLPFNSAPGNLACVSIQDSSGATVSSLTGVNTYANISEQVNSSLGVESLWYAKNIVGGKLSPSATMSSNVSGNMSIVEYSGLDTTAPLDLTTVGNGTGLTQSLTSATPNFLFELCVYAYGGSGSNAAVAGTVSSPFVIAASTVFNSGQCLVAHATQFSPGAVPPVVTASSDWTGSGTTEHYGVVLAMFKIAASPTVEYLASAIAGASSLTGAVTVTHRLIATSTGTSSVAGSLTVTHRLVATVTGTSSLTGALTVTHRLSATVSGASALSGALTVTHLLSATSTGISALTGALTITHRLTATVSGVSALSGALTVIRALHGTVLGTSVISGSLTVRYETLPVVTSAPFALNTATSEPFALNTAVTGVDA